MTDFSKYKARKEQEKENTRKRREEILDELHNIDTELLEMQIPEAEGNVSYTFVEEKKFQELEKLAEVSQKLGQEARMVAKNWDKSTLDLLFN